MAAPKTVTLFLIDGSPAGRIKCTLGNWIGQRTAFLARKLHVPLNVKSSSRLVCTSFSARMLIQAMKSPMWVRLASAKTAMVCWAG